MNKIEIIAGFCNEGCQEKVNFAKYLITFSVNDVRKLFVCENCSCLYSDDILPYETKYMEENKMNKKINWSEVENRLIKEFKGTEIIPYSNCCRSCYLNEFDNEDNIFMVSLFSPQSMNFRNNIDKLYVNWEVDKIDLKSIINYKREFDYLVSILGTSIKNFILPKDNSEVIILELEDTIDFNREEYEEELGEQND